MFFFYVLFLLYLCTRLFICALWSPAGNGADLLVLVCGVWLWFCYFPIGIMGQVWYLIVSISDLCTLTFIPQRSFNPFAANRSGIPVVHILQPICHKDGFLRLLVSHIPMVVKDM